MKVEEGVDGKTKRGVSRKYEIRSMTCIEVIVKKKLLRARKLLIDYTIDESSFSMHMRLSHFNCGLSISRTCCRLVCCCLWSKC